MTEEERFDGTLAVERRVEADGTVVLKLRGELDLATVGLLAPAIAELRASRPDAVTVDLGEVTFIGSAGLASLVELARDVGVVWLRSPSRMLLRVIAYEGLTEVLHLEP